MDTTITIIMVGMVIILLITITLDGVTHTTMEVITEVIIPVTTKVIGMGIMMVTMEIIMEIIIGLGCPYEKNRQKFKIWTGDRLRV